MDNNFVKHVDHLKKYKVFQTFFSMVPMGCTFHFKDCDWLVHKSGPDTCKCTHFLFDMYSLINGKNDI
jgi:hypothetical protein